MSKIKENWLKVDEHCPNCNAVTKPAKGINRQNLLRLVKPRKPTYTEVIVIVFLVLFMITSIAYRNDTAVCREYVQRNIAYWDNLTNGTFQIPHLQDSNMPNQLNISLLK